MSKVVKGFLAGLAILGAVAFPACHKKQPPKVTQTDTTPTVSMPPPPTTTTAETKVENTDFVSPKAEPTVTAEALPTNVEELNRVAQEKGFLQDAFFGYDESALSSDAQAALSASAAWLKQHTEYNILVEGHCDERGTEQYNLALGDRRANIVKQYLQTLGVDASRMRTVSYGEERPFDAGHDESSWAKNRRAHLVIVGR
jgi:peptidoglycan-associated lipoprotein